MKKYFLLFAIAGLFACNSEESKDTKVASATDDSTMKSAAVTLPYTATYSSQFEMGNAEHTKLVLDLWKDWDAGDPTRSKDKFADSVYMLFPDGSTDEGPRDSVVAHAQNYRNMFTAMRSVVHAVMPLRATDKNENWVCVWGTEYHTDKSGKSDSLDLQETWRIDQNGKVAYMMQYARPARRDKK